MTGAPPAHRTSDSIRWQRAGVRDRVLADLQRRPDTARRLDWTLHVVDSTVVRALQHAAGPRADPETATLGCSRGGYTTKVHVLERLINRLKQRRRIATGSGKGVATAAGEGAMAVMSGWHRTRSDL